jgi:hypothetical protein
MHQARLFVCLFFVFFLLGVNFDFFGIGEFWGCKSVQNDFGLQFRFYYYENEIMLIIAIIAMMWIIGIQVTNGIIIILIYCTCNVNCDTITRTKNTYS